ncbi:Predicted membrane protein [Phaffia rhodozyma]|uniref:Endoplasmic reticulum junction formation protein lunapark n=1 Tax=Phaffia rhodozyma TaxID=264483 RepID=A0A0F7SMG7_PHARH|nr:Predicted membrane protein [Phaffia rhodozyma]
MGVFSWFQKKPELDYETLLQTLSQSIQDKQQHLSEIKLRERRSTLLVTLYLIGFWILYALLWWIDYLPLGLMGFNSQPDEWESDDERGLVESYGGIIILALPAFIGPIVIIFIRRTVKAWYTRQELSEEKQLRDLRARQRTTIEEIKKKTNYYSTRNLLERYDEAPSPTAAKLQQQQQQANLRKRGAFQPPVDPRLQPSTPGSPSPNSIKPNTPSADLIGTPINRMNPQTPLSAIGGPHMSSALFASGGMQPVTPPTPPRKTLFDRAADYILGDEAGGSKGDMGKFALVCGKCFTWNGLVEEARWGDMQYVCPKCGFFNPSPNSLSKKDSNPLNASLPVPPMTRTRSTSPLAEELKSGPTTPPGKTNAGKTRKGKGKNEKLETTKDL